MKHLHQVEPKVALAVEKIAKAFEKVNEKAKVREYQRFQDQELEL